LSSAASRLAGDRPVPHIVTELPGPKARAHVAFDEEWTSPSLPRAYPIVPVRGDGLTVEDIDGNLFLDFAAGIFSDDEAEVQTFLDRIQAGTVYVNRRAGATTGAWPGVQAFGGWKGSGSTGKAGLSMYYVAQFLREQSHTIVD